MNDISQHLNLVTGRWLDLSSLGSSCSDDALAASFYAASSLCCSYLLYSSLSPSQSVFVLLSNQAFPYPAVPVVGFHQWMLTFPNETESIHTPPKIVGGAGGRGSKLNKL